MKQQGALCIGKVNSNSEDKPVYVSLDIVTAEKVVKVELSLEEFSRVLFGEYLRCEVIIKDRKV